MIARPNIGGLWLAAWLLAGCAPAAMTPVLNLGGQPCANAPDLISALPLAMEKSAAATIEAGSPCLLSADGRRSAYVAFQLPQAAEPYLLEVASRRRGSTLLAPRLLLLDGLGQPVREVPRDRFMFRGSDLEVGVRAAPGERYLVVASDPIVVGQRESRITGSTQATTAATGTGFFVIHTGSENASSLVFAHNGAVTVTARPWPKVGVAGD